MKKGLGISGMKRPLLGTTESSDGAEAVAPPPTPMARRGIAISGGARRLGISGMNRPLIAPVVSSMPTSNYLPAELETDGDVLP